MLRPVATGAGVPVCGLLVRGSVFNGMAEPGPDGLGPMEPLQDSSSRATNDMNVSRPTD